MAKAVKGSLREVDFMARLGGEELAIVLVDVDEVGASARAERLRRVVAALGEVTASFRVCVYEPSFDGPAALIKAADVALYSAKKAGRDCVVPYSTLRSLYGCGEGDRAAG